MLRSNDISEGMSNVLPERTSQPSQTICHNACLITCQLAARTHVRSACQTTCRITCQTSWRDLHANEDVRTHSRTISSLYDSFCVRTCSRIDAVRTVSTRMSSLVCVKFFKQAGMVRPRIRCRDEGFGAENSVSADGFLETISLADRPGDACAASI